MLKVRVSCPVCGQPIRAGSLERHLESSHELTGVVTLRLHPVNPYSHEPEAEVVELAPEEAEGGGEEPTATATTPEPEAKTEPETEPGQGQEKEPGTEPGQGQEKEPGTEPGQGQEKEPGTEA